MSFDLLKELTEAPGIAGREEAIRKVIERELKGIVDTLREDALGNLIAYRAGKSKKPRKIMYAAHMDEIGYIVRFIDDNGFIRLNPVGGIDPRNLISQRVRIVGKQELVGVVSTSTKPIHVQTDEDRKKHITNDDLFVDVGLPVKEVKKQLSPGDLVVLERTTFQIGNRVTGKAMDNRTAVYTLIQSIKKSKNNQDELHAVFTAQEEVGARGATTSGFGIVPEIAIALDVTLAVDTPGTEAKDAITRLGEGVALTIMDSGMISDYKLIKEFENLAEKNKIKYQPNILPRGGTDAGAMQRVCEGARAITISLPTRYVHTSIETIDWGDLEAKIDLVSAYMQHSGR